jgi:hypothetical protein
MRTAIGCEFPDRINNRELHGDRWIWQRNAMFFHR